MTGYYDRSNLKRIPELMRLAPQASEAYLAFEEETYRVRGEGALSAQTKELIAVAVAHVSGCPYCIDTHVKKCKALGGTKEQLLEAVLVAASTRAGAILSHATNALIAFEEGPADADALERTSEGDPECFC